MNKIPQFVILFLFFLKLKPCYFIILEFSLKLLFLQQTIMQQGRLLADF